MSKILLFIGVLVISSCNSVEQQEFVRNYPLDWIGTWEGDLLLYPSGDSINMILHIDSTIHKDTLIWKLKYANKDIRDYRMILLDTKGKMIIDEGNGIKLNAQLFGNHVSSIFEVNGNLLTITYQLIDKNELLFEVVSSSNNNKLISGDTIINNKNIPQVISYYTQAYQKALLTK